MQTRSIFLALVIFAAGLGIGYYIGHHPVLTESVASQTQQSGMWRARVKVPGSVQLPTENPVLKCTFSKTIESSLGFLSVTHENLTDRSFIVKYAIFGYDGKGRRIGKGVDEFAIGKHESVLRKVFFESETPGLRLPADTAFVIQVFPESNP